MEMKKRKKYRVNCFQFDAIWAQKVTKLFTYTLYPSAAAQHKNLWQNTSQKYIFKIQNAWSDFQESAWFWRLPFLKML